MTTLKWSKHLIPLFEQDGLRMGEPARRGRLSKQALTQLVRRLEADGLVGRRVDPRDRRASLISLTERSRALRPVAEATLQRLDRRAQELLGAARVRELRAALRDVVEHGLA